MKKYQVRERLHHGDLLTHTVRTATTLHQALLEVLQASPYNFHVLKSKEKVRSLVQDLHEHGKAAYGWADYTLEVIDA